MTRIVRLMPALFVLIAVAATLAGSIESQLWLNVPLRRALELLGFGAFFISLTVACWHYSPRLAFGVGVAVVALPWLLAYGPMPIISVATLALAALAVGSLFPNKGTHGQLVLATLSGCAVIAAVAGWLLPFPLHYQATWAGALIIICWWRRTALSRLLRYGIHACLKEVQQAPKSAALAVTVLAVATTPAWLPALTWDDLSSHLYIPYSMSTRGYYAMDVQSHIWGMAPWATDVLQGVAQVLAGRESSGPLDGLWLWIAAAAVYSLSKQLGLSAPLAWTALGLYVSQPLSAALTSSMQTEGPSAAMAAALALIALSRVNVTGSRRCGPWLVFAMIAGLAIGTKITNIAFVLPITVLATWTWRTQLRWQSILLCAAIGAACAGSSYIYALLLTGNPLLPLYNDIFHSHYFAFERFLDGRWVTGFGLELPWRITFGTNHYYEGPPGAAGLWMMGMSGAIMAASLSRKLRPLMIVGLLAFAIPLFQIQYFRYAHPASAILLPVLLGGMYKAVGMITASSIASAILILQSLLLPTGYWTLGHGALRELFKHGPTGVFESYAPQRGLSQLIRQRLRPSDRILFTDEPFTAELTGLAFNNSAWDPELHSLTPPRSLATEVHVAPKTENEERLAAESDRMVDASVRFSGANYMEIRPGTVSAGILHYLRTYNAQLAFQFGDSQIYRLAAQGGEAMTISGNPERWSGQTKLTISEPTIIDAKVIITCESPGGRLVIQWYATRKDGRVHKVLTQQAGCGSDDKAVVATSFRADERLEMLHVSVQPLFAPQNVNHVANMQATVNMRRDTDRIRDLARRIQNAVLPISSHAVEPIDTFIN